MLSRTILPSSHHNRSAFNSNFDSLVKLSAALLLLQPLLVLTWRQP
jgi:hypothetical protein